MPWIKVLFTILLGKKKKNRCSPLVGVLKQISEQLFKRAHFCFDHRMRLETAFFWLHCILSTPLLMPNHISSLLKYRPCFVLTSFSESFFCFVLFSFSKAVLSLSRMLSDTNSVGNVRLSRVGNPTLSPRSNAEYSSLSQ